MNRISKLLLLVTTIATTALVAFFTGELIGMKSGHAHSVQVTAPRDAAYTVSVIKLIENGLYQEAIEMLETRLDTQLVNHWSSTQCRLTALNPFIREKPGNDLFYSAITHRKSRPSDIEIITDHLKDLENELYPPPVDSP